MHELSGFKLLKYKLSMIKSMTVQITVIIKKPVFLLE